MRKISIRVPCTCGELGGSGCFGGGRLDCANSANLAVGIAEYEITGFESHDVPVMGEGGTLLIGGWGPQVPSSLLLAIRSAFVDPPNIRGLGLASEQRQNLWCTAFVKDVESLEAVFGLVTRSTIQIPVRDVRRPYVVQEVDELPSLARLVPSPQFVRELRVPCFEQHHAR